MDLREIIDEIACQADDFLANTRDLQEARVAITEMIAADHPELSEKSRRIAVAEVMHILEEEDFFGIPATADRWTEDSSNDD